MITEIKVNKDQQSRLLNNARNMMMSARNPAFKSYWEKVYITLSKKFNKLN
jgi:hypothetical protein